MSWLTGVISAGRSHSVWLAVLVVMLSGIAVAAHAAGYEAVATTLPNSGAVVMTDGQRHNGFDRPLWLESENGNGTASGTIKALLEFPFTAINAALSQPASWCDILMLHFNIKSCRLVHEDDEITLDVGIGRKFDDPSARVYRVGFVFGVVKRSDDVLHVELVARDGPLSTRNYRIVVLATRVAAQQTVVHLSYAYDYGVVGKLAMRAYLGTLGRNKVGFTVEGEDSDGRPRYIRGMRGAMERNAMRYCLAVESFMRSLSRPQHERVEARLQDWFTSLEQYSHQLYEMDRDEYLKMKRNEIERQRRAGAGS